MNETIQQSRKDKTRNRLLSFAFWIGITISSFASTLGPFGAPYAQASGDFFVYSVTRPIDLGNGEPTPKDFYVNMGSAQGIRKGSLLSVTRKTATYDLVNEKIYKDVTVPVGTLKVIHVEKHAAIARLEKLHPTETHPTLSIPGILVGDYVESTSSP